MYICNCIILLIFLIYITRISGLRAVCRKRNNWLEMHKILWHKCVYIYKSPISLSTAGSKQQGIVGVWMLQDAVQHRDTIFEQAGCHAGSRGAAAAQSTSLDQHIHTGVHADSLRHPKTFLSLIPGSLTVMLKSKSVWWGHAEAGCNGAVLSQCANHVEKVQAEPHAHALCRAVRQHSQDWTPGCSKKAQVSWARVALP